MQQKKNKQKPMSAMLALIGENWPSYLGAMIATVLIVAFELFNVPFNTWLFLLYGAVLTAMEAVIFTSLWWNLWWQLGSWSALIWLGGLTVLLTVPGIVDARILLICAALQTAVTFWILYRRSRILPELRNEHPAKRKETDK